MPKIVRNSDDFCEFMTKGEEINGKLKNINSALNLNIYNNFVLKLLCNCFISCFLIQNIWILIPRLQNFCKIKNSAVIASNQTANMEKSYN